MSSETAIVVDRVSKCYPVYARPSDRLRQYLLPVLHRTLRRPARMYHEEYWALRDISFHIARGEQVGIVGRNGAGKSTLLQIICGTVAPTSGTVRAAGRVAALLELGAGFNPELTGHENIHLYGSVLGLSDAQIDQAFDAIVAFADIPGFIEHAVKTYSSGMFMRLAFAVAVHVNPEILVVDEALSVGDEAFQRKCHARIRMLRDAGTSILFVSHSAGHVVEVCDRAILLDHGELLAIGTAKEVVGKYQKLVYAPLGHDVTVRERLRNEHAAVEIEVAPNTAEIAVPDEASDEDIWEPELAPTQTLAYPERGCLISDTGLYDGKGRRVNVLRADVDYVYRYRVHFERAAVGVRFGMMIKSLTGVELAGAISHRQHEAIAHVPAGTTVTVEFAWRNCLNPGTYFLNAGVVGLEGEGETYLARLLDVVMFRVVGSTPGVATGFIDAGIRARVIAT